VRIDPLRDPRLRILAAVVLAFTFSALQGALALGMMVLLTAGLVMASDLSVRKLARALHLPGLVVAGLVVVLPFASGATALVQIGPLTLTREGLLVASVIALRFVCIFTMVAVFLGTMPMPQILRGLRGLRGLGLPDLMVDMALLTLRHIGDLQQDLARMQLAHRLRGGSQGQRWFAVAQFKATGWILANLLLRSHARSARVYHAMILRGHGAADAAPLDPLVAPRSDKLVMIALFAIAGALFGIDRLT